MRRAKTFDSNLLWERLGEGGFPTRGSVESLLLPSPPPPPPPPPPLLIVVSVLLQGGVGNGHTHTRMYELCVAITTRVCTYVYTYTHT